jgi:putative phage-type endonuclease
MLNVVQGSPEWLQARCGSLGASAINEALATTKGGWGASRENLKARIIAERLTGAPQETFSNAAMQWGNDQEDNAANAYAFLTGNAVEVCGLYFHPTLLATHASPDRLVGDDGLVEIKCPNTATHIATLRTQKVPSKYMTQMQWQMACTNRKWCDFVSYDPRLPEDLQLFVARVERDDERIAELEAAIGVFLDEVQADLDAINAIRSK